MSDIEKVKKLREATGAGFKDCNSAIKESNGNLDKAISCYSDALTLDPDMLETRFNLGLALFKMNKLDDAEICFKKVITLEQKYFIAYLISILGQKLVKF